jgi:hypothetical protein
MAPFVSPALGGTGERVQDPKILEGNLPKPLLNRIPLNLQEAPAPEVAREVAEAALAEAAQEVTADVA